MYDGSSNRKILGLSLLYCWAFANRAEAYVPPQLSKAELLSDLEQLDQVLQDNHPNLFEFTSAHDYSEQLRLAAVQFENGGTAIDFYNVVAPIVASIQDVHTRIVPSTQGQYQLPLRLLPDGASNYLPVSPIAIRALPTNAQLRAINGEALELIVSDMLKGVSGSQPSYRSAYLQKHMDDYLISYTNWGPAVDLTFCIPTTAPLLNSEQESNQKPCQYEGQSGYLEYINIPTLPIENRIVDLPYRGVRLLQLNGLPDSKGQRETAERFMVVSSAVSELQAEDIVLELNGHPFQESDMDVLNASDNVIELRISRNGRQEAIRLTEMPYPPLPAFDYEPISPEVMRLNIWRFEDQEAFRAMLEEMFRVMRKRGQGQLVIDLRESEGAHSALIKTFYAFVSEDKFRLYQYREQLRNADFRKERPGMYFILPLMRSWRVEGQRQVYRIPYRMEVPFERSIRFHGDIIILTSVNTLSAAASFAAVLSDHKRAVVIGEETGGAACPTGGVEPFMLEHTQLHGHVSRYTYARPNGDCRGGGVQPDRHVEPEDSLKTAVDILYLKRAD